MKVQNISQYLDHLGSLNLYQQILGKQEARESPRAPQRSHPYMRSQHLLLLRHVALPPVGRSVGRSRAGFQRPRCRHRARPTPASFSLSVPPATDCASSSLSFFKPFCASLPLPLHFLCLLPFNFPALSLPFSHRPPARPSLSSSTHFMQRWGYLRD